MPHAESGALIKNCPVGDREGPRPESAVSPHSQGPTLRTEFSPQPPRWVGNTDPISQTDPFRDTEALPRVTSPWRHFRAGIFTQILLNHKTRSSETQANHGYNPGAIPSCFVTSGKSLYFSEPPLPLISKVNHNIDPAGCWGDGRRRRGMALCSLLILLQL